MKSLFQKDTVFFGLFLIGYYLQNKDRAEQKVFISKQQEVLVDLTAAVQEISKNQEKHNDRLERIENRFNSFVDKN